MTIRVDFREGDPSAVAEARYRTDEFSLTYRHPGPVRNEDGNLADRIGEMLGVRKDEQFFAVAGTLAIGFAGVDRQLVAFDAYTNCDRWRRVKRAAIPEVAGVGRVVLAESLPGGRVDLSVEPEYRYSEGMSILEISLARVSGTLSHYRVSNRLIVGTQGGSLATLLLHDLQVT
jgi:hypothetical protein